MRALALLLMLASSEAHATPPATVQVEVTGSIISVLPQGSRTVVIINRGSLQGLEVGDRVVHPAGECRLREVYQFRSKCLMDFETATLRGRLAVVVHVRRPASPAPSREARVLSQAPDEGGTSLELDLGYAHGVRLADEGVVEGKPCRVWEVREQTSWCATDLPSVSAGVLQLSPSGLPDQPMTGGLQEWLAPPRRPPEPKPGVREPAPPLVLARIRREGLVASHRCLGFTPDEAKVYVLTEDPKPAVQPLPGETGLVLHEVDVASATARPLATFNPLEVAQAQQRLDARRIDEGLLACHEGDTRMLDPDGSGPLGVQQIWLAAHGADQGVYLRHPGRAALISAGVLGDARGPTPFLTLAPVVRAPAWDETDSAKPRYPWIAAFYFLPGSNRHLVLVDGRWHLLVLEPR